MGDQSFPNASKCFTNTTVSWVPVSSTEVNNESITNLYNVYPTNAKSSVSVSGLDIQQVEFFNMEGKSVLKTNQTKIDVEGLSSGVYFVRILTPGGVVSKKIIKQ